MTNRKDVNENNNVYIYPIVISESQDETSDFKFFVEIPDFCGFTQARSFEESITMARDFIGNALVELAIEGEAFPSHDTEFKSLNSLKKSDDDIVTTVDVNYSIFKHIHDNKTVRKNVTIPLYLEVLGRENNINFSEMLTNSLKNLLVD